MLRGFTERPAVGILKTMTLGVLVVQLVVLVVVWTS
jgi:hypothetical protein